MVVLHSPQSSVQPQHETRQLQELDAGKMKAGDLCRCITNFSGVLPDEITVYQNDIVQVDVISLTSFLQKYTKLTFSFIV